jgi:hypothetical protein
MNGERRSLLFLIQAGMELSWLSACITFVDAALVNQAMPFLYAIAVFAVAALVGYLSLGRGWRNYLVLLAQTAFLSGALMTSVYALCYSSHAIFSYDWILLAFHGPHSQKEWAELILLCLSIVIYWIGGMSLARRQMTYYSVCTRFDIGLAAFFGLFLIELVIVAKGVGGSGGSLTIYPLFSFLLLGLIGIGMAKAHPSGSRSFLPGHAIVGVIASFAAAVLLIAASVTLFFLPVLQKTADVGYRAVAIGGRFIAPFVVGTLRFLFGPRNMRPDPPSPSTTGTAALDHIFAPASWWGRVIEDMMQWGMKGLAALMLLVGAGLLVFFVARWLAARSATGVGHLKRDDQISWWSRLRLIFIALIAGIARLLTRCASATDFYWALQSWGRRSGIPLRLTDTPAEFGNRLSRCHPMLTPNIETIVEAFNRQTYGNACITGIELAEAHSSLRSLRSPRHWARRLRTRLTKP